jgi:disulfide bond formation protein DsbB
MTIASMLGGLRQQPLVTLARWQDQRTVWALMVVLAVTMLVVAHTVFQHWLYMRPCEQCVYVRFAFLCMATGGLVAMISPRNAVLKVVGYGLAFWGVIQGIGYALKLDRIHHAVHSDNPFGVQGCSTEPSFPLGLPLDRWSADWFKPTGDCGFDNPIIPDGAQLSSLQRFLTDFYADGWYLWPPTHFMNMAQAVLITFGLCLAVLSLFAAAWLVSLSRQRAGTGSTRQTLRGA